MRIVLDSNILLRLANSADAQRQAVLTALALIHSGGHDPIVVPQVLYEFWVVATRPVDQNGLGLAPLTAEKDLSEFRQDYTLVDDLPGVVDIWQQLIARYEVLGKPARDARLVAAMLRHGVTHLLTFNEADFSRYAEIVPVNPANAASIPAAGG